MAEEQKGRGGEQGGYKEISHGRKEGQETAQKDWIAEQMQTGVGYDVNPLVRGVDEFTGTALASLKTLSGSSVLGFGKCCARANHSAQASAMA